MERILFVIGLCGAAFAYGVATMQYQVFPYRVLKQAKLAIEAWSSVDGNDHRLPRAFEHFEAGASGEPSASVLRDGAGTEHLLITGGPYQLMDRCPTWGCMAWITDRAGKILHSWEIDLDQLWDGLDGIAGTPDHLDLYPVGMALGKDGSLVVTFQGRETYPIQIGIMKADREGNVLWKRFDRSHHWITMDDAGQVYTPAMVPARRLDDIAGTPVDLLCKAGESGVDVIRILSAQGEPVRELRILDAVARAYPGLFYAIRDGCDPTHLNSIALVPREVAGVLPGTRPGDLLVSLRETNTVAVLDGQSAAVRYLVNGRTAAQHGPRWLPDGTVLVFDNLGGDPALGGTRVARIDMRAGTAHTVFPRAEDRGLLPLRSETGGHIDVSADGTRALVAVTHQGRVVEIDVASGAPLWLYENTHDVARFLRANDLDDEITRARFSTYGAYYVFDTAFLEDPS
jgi:DNA-binding beta-propeller fold protein YncE